MTQASAIRHSPLPATAPPPFAILTLHQGHGAPGSPAGIVNAEPSIEGGEIQAAGNGAQGVILKSSRGLRTPLRNQSDGATPCVWKVDDFPP